jgi:hypothetical protein
VELELLLDLCEEPAVVTLFLQTKLLLVVAELVLGEMLLTATETLNEVYLADLAEEQLLIALEFLLL